MFQVSAAAPVLTVSQIQDRLPLVRRIAGDLVSAWARILRTRSELEACQISSGAEQRDMEQELVEQLDRLVSRVQGLIGEVEQLGGSFQEYRRGVVNFVTERDGRHVLACWVPGESELRGWHEPNETAEQCKPF
ncbi:MAG: DUF2203 family protein [Planctomycetes bacterium]|nr:DUF2203 family protein [Planctomycetota bacterium]